MDAVVTAENSPQGVFVGPGSAPVTLWGRRSTTASIKSLADFALAAPARLVASTVSNPENDLARWTAAASRNAFATVERLSAVSGPEAASKSSYPESALATQLQFVGKLIRSGSQARVYYTVQSGYDTHAVQANEHYELLKNLADGLKALIDDLKADGLADQVLILTFSEFGRRAAENDSEGTDHGAAAPVFLAGPKFASGIFGPAPNLGDLASGDVKTTIDFRQVYATILDRWLTIPPRETLGGDFDQLNLFPAAV
jgi:uncharacterized protein (DUF1501 family)